MKISHLVEDLFYHLAHKWDVVKVLLKRFLCVHNFCPSNIIFDHDEALGEGKRFYFSRCDRCSKLVKFKTKKNVDAEEPL